MIKNLLSDAMRGLTLAFMVYLLAEFAKRYLEMAEEDTCSALDEAGAFHRSDAERW